MNMQKALQRYRETAQLIDYNPSMGACMVRESLQSTIHDSVPCIDRASISLASSTNPKTPSGSVDYQGYRDH